MAKFDTVSYASSTHLLTSKGWVHIQTIIMDMVKEFGITKTHQTIQALYDAGRIDQNTAGFLLDDLKQECSRKQAMGLGLL